MKNIILLFATFLSLKSDCQEFSWRMRNDSLFVVNGSNWIHVRSGAIFAFGHLLGTQVLRIRNDSTFMVNGNTWTYVNGTTYAFTELIGEQIIGLEGGASGQYFKKNSNADYDYSWASLPNYAPVTTTDSMRTNIYNALNAKQVAGNYAPTATTDSMRTNIYNALNGKQPTGSYLVAADIAGKANLVSPSFTTPSLGVATATSIAATGSILSSGGGIGYSSGAGGTVSQGGNKGTAVTINKLSGQITMVNSALAAGAEVKFTVNNNTVSATDVVIANIQSVGTSGSYLISVGAVANGSFDITISNASAGSLSQALVINFAVIKAVAN